MSVDPKFEIKASDAKSLVDILSESKWYMVPEFQRGYRWTEQNIADLIYDLCSTEQKGKARHFMGTYVLISRGKENYNCEKEFRTVIIDGQQRLATLVIILAVIRDVSEAHKWKIHNQLTNRLWSNLDVRKPCDRIILGEKDCDLFHSIIHDKKTEDTQSIKEYFDLATRCSGEELKLLNLAMLKKERNKRNQRLYKAYQLILREIAKEMPCDMKDASEWISRLSSWVLFRMTGCEVVTYDEGMAYEVFESLNARGLGLTPSELLKNHLFSVAKPEGSLDQVKDNWTVMEDNLPTDDASGFLRHWYMSKEGYVSTKNLYRAIQQHLTVGGTSALKMSELLVEESEIYGKILEPEGNFKDDVVDSLMNIKDLGMSILYPLLLSVFRKFTNPNYRFDISKFLEVLSFRFITICGGRGNELEKDVCDWAIKIRRGRAGKKAIDDAKSALRKRNPDDDFFYQQFLKKTFPSNTRPARYLLGRIEKLIRGGLGTASPYQLVREKVQIEHIFPQKPNNDAKNYMIAQGVAPSDKDLKGRIGNLTLLCGVYNKQASNNSFPKKMKDYYAKSEIELTKLFVNGHSGKPSYTSPTDWNETEIDARQRWLVDYAKEKGIWDIN